MERNKPTRETDPSIRIKVNNDCQWSCTFCHNEGTEVPSNQKNRVSVFLDKKNTEALPPVQNMPYSEEIMNDILALRDQGISEVHLTGGEPTLHPDILSIVRDLADNDMDVKMTSNGQTSTKIIEGLADAGISGINFSILSFDPEEFSKTQHVKSIPLAKAMIEREKRNILFAKELGIDVKINTVVLGEHDYYRVDTVRQFAEENDITLVLLNSIGDGDESQNAVFDYSEQHGEYQGSKEYTNSSKGSRFYETPSGSQIKAKYLREYHPDVVCEGCEHRGKDSCVEKFYGIRMEFRDNEPYIRLCVQRTDEQSVMPLEVFNRENIIEKL